MITEDPAAVDAILKSEGINYPWLGNRAKFWRQPAYMLVEGFDDFEGTQRLAEQIVKETGH